MWLLKISWLNLLRNKRRSFTTLLLITVGNIGMMLIGGFGLFSFQSLEQQSARDTGHLLISHPNYFTGEEENLLDFGLSDFQKIIDKHKGDRKIKYMLQTLEFQGLISNGNKSAAFIGRGINPKELRARGPFITILDGNGLHSKFSEARTPEVLLGKDLAKILNADVKSILTVLSTGTEGLNGFDVEVAGIFTTGIPEYDKRSLIIDYHLAQELMQTDKVSFISVHLENSDNIAEYQKKFESENQATTHWQELAFFYKGVKSLYTNIFGFIGGIVMLVVFFSVYNAMNTAVWERTREIGILGALGTQQSNIIFTFMGEGLWLAVLTALISLPIYLLVNLGLSVADIQLAPPPGRTSSYPLQVTFSINLYIFMMLASFIVIEFAAYFSSLRASKMPIILALAQY